MSETDIVEMDLDVAYASLSKARALIEDNADSGEPHDAATLRRVYSLVIEAICPVAGARGVVRQRRQRRELAALIAEERPAESATVLRLRVVR